MNNQKLHTYLGILIRRGEIEEMQSLLKKAFEAANDQDLLNKLTQLGFQKTELEDPKKADTLTKEQQRISKNKLIGAFIRLKGELEDLPDVSHVLDKVQLPKEFDPASILEDYTSLLTGPRYNFPSDDPSEDVDKMLAVFDLSDTLAEEVLFYYDSSYWIGGKTGILLTKDKIRAKEPAKKAKEADLLDIDLDSFRLEERYGIFRDLCIDEQKFYRFDNLIPKSAATYIKNLVHEMAFVKSFDV